MEAVTCRVLLSLPQSVYRLKYLAAMLIRSIRMPFTFLTLWQMSPVGLQHEFGRWCASAARGNASSNRLPAVSGLRSPHPSPLMWLA
jgi:hypothetical protein